MFEHFEKRLFSYDSIIINYVIGGTGPPLLLLHGYPQTHVIWHKIAPALAEKYTVVISDLRGYGDSSKPPTDEKHTPYSKRATAKDQVELMKALGFDKFLLVGHDRGGRVGHRLALDYPEVVEKLVVMDIAPTYTMYKTTDMDFAKAYYHWFFLIQPADIPERMIGADPLYFLNKKFGQWGRDSPVLAIWGAKGFVGNKYDVVAEWKKWATVVTGYSLPCGHYLPEEAPDETLAALLSFL